MAKEGKSKGLQALALTSTISMEIAATVTLGFLGGRYLDRHFGTEPWIMVTGVLLGVALGILGIVQTLERFFKDKE
jgi:F0F1-type ATP synthase assembly protein I